jgi:hypothetical protein
VNALDTPITVVTKNKGTSTTAANPVDIPIMAMMTNVAVCPSMLKSPSPTKN